jgi:hypothetical protein
MLDLMDQIPTNLENDRKHPLVSQVARYFQDQEWVEDFRIRMREAGDVFFTEVFVIPVQDHSLTGYLQQSADDIRQIDWKLFDVVIMPVSQFTDEQEEAG